jgi:predicted RND superfamily exporter protein
MYSLRQRIAIWIIGHQKASWFAFIAITAFFAVGLRDVELRTIFSDLLPKDEQDALTKQRRRNALQTQLNLAVEAERFEEAAKLRDELKALEK